MKEELANEDMKNLSFVRWDRFVTGTNYLCVFGWIKRRDAYKDFVTLAYNDEGLLWWQTSSALRTKEIAGIISAPHADCKRIENYFNIGNSIKLKGGGEE